MITESQSDDAIVEATTEKMSWRRALMFSAGAIYLPQLVMCLYMLLFVPCDHCKKYCWIVAPLAPGGFIWEWARHFMGLPHMSSWLGISAAACLTLAMIVGFASVLRRFWRWRYPLLVLMLAASTGLAFVVLGVMRA